ncbi:MAG TPA: discoidin domain-containing protein, partial [Tepidisphaeraceae bacterium]|nr:discoidin domain-containing protein [Tepidisphaeraceae bacterium]
ASTLRASTVSSPSGFNGAFEANPVNANGWQAVADGGSTPTFTWDSGTFHGGSRSAKVVATTAAGASVSKTSAANRVPVNAGSLYAVRVWGKSSSVSDPAATFETAKNSNVYVQFFDATGNVLGPKSQAGWGWSGTEDWRQVHLLATAPATAASMSIELRLDAPGTMWFDDLTVTEYSDQPVRNHNFEGGTTGWSYATVVADNSRTGTQALRLAANGYVEQQVFDLEPGKAYTARFWAKNSSAANTNGYVGITFRDSGGNTVSGGNSTVVSGTSYTPYAIDVTVPANAVRADVWAWTGSTHTGYLYVDDVTLTGNSLVKQSGRIIGTTGSWSNHVDRTRVAAFDGNLSTYFDAPDASASTAWVGVDLGRATVVGQIKYAPRASYAGRMVGGKFQGSNTADFSSGVVDLTTTIAAAPPVGQLTTVAVSNASAFRYVRYLAPASSYGNIAEMEVHGRGLPVPLPITAAPVVTNGSFETSNVAASSHLYGSNVAGAGWAFIGNAGIQKNGSSLGGSSAPSGTATAFLQTNGGSAGSFQQSITFTTAGSFKVSFQSAKRSFTSGGGADLSFRVYAGTTLIGTFTPASTSFASFVTDSFTVTANQSVTLKFEGVAGTGDHSAFIDDVSVILP